MTLHLSGRVHVHYYSLSRDGHVVRRRSLTQTSLLHSAVDGPLDHRIIDYLQLEETHTWVIES